MSLLDKLKEKESEIEKGYDVLFWKPEPGEIIEGVVGEIGTTITGFGDSDYIQIQTEDDKKYMIFCNGYLKRLLEEEEVQEGDFIAIKFAGYVQSKKYKTRKFKSYILVKADDSETDNPDSDDSENE
jgi:DNA helicase TIP49 (TBP-interacting protein)